MDEFVTFYVDHYNVYHLPPVLNPYHGQPVNEMEPDQIGTIMQLDDPNANAQRIYGWLNSQGPGSSDSGVPLPEYHLNADQTSPTEIEGDPFIRSELL